MRFLDRRDARKEVTEERISQAEKISPQIVKDQI